MGDDEFSNMSDKELRAEAKANGLYTAGVSNTRLRYRLRRRRKILNGKQLRETDVPYFTDEGMQALADEFGGKNNIPRSGEAAAKIHAKKKETGFDSLSSLVAKAKKRHLRWRGYTRAELDERIRMFDDILYGRRPFRTDDAECMNIGAVRAIAKRLKIKGASNMKRDDLLDAIEERNEALVVLDEEDSSRRRRKQRSADKAQRKAEKIKVEGMRDETHLLLAIKDTNHPNDLTSEGLKETSKPDLVTLAKVQGLNPKRSWTKPRLIKAILAKQRREQKKLSTATDDDDEDYDTLESYVEQLMHGTAPLDGSRIASLSISTLKSVASVRGLHYPRKTTKKKLVELIMDDIQ